MAQRTQEEKIRQALQNFLEAGDLLEERLRSRGEDRLTSYRERLEILIKQLVDTHDLNQKEEIIREIYSLDRPEFPEIANILRRLRERSDLFPGLVDVSRGDDGEAIDTLDNLQAQIVKVYVRDGGTYAGPGAVIVKGSSSGNIITGNQNSVYGQGSGGGKAPQVIDQKTAFPTIECDYHVYVGTPFWFNLLLSGVAQGTGDGSHTSQTPQGVIEIYLGDQIKLLRVRLHVLDFETLSPVDHPLTYIVSSGDSNRARFLLKPKNKGVDRYFTRVRATVEDEYHKPITEVVQVLEVLKADKIVETDVVHFPTPANLP